MDILNKILSDTAALADQEEALKDPYTAYRFALDVKGADIEKCQEAACKKTIWAYHFAIMVKKADIKMSLEACKGTQWEDWLNEALMRKALI